MDFTVQSLPDLSTYPDFDVTLNITVSEGSEALVTGGSTMVTVTVASIGSSGTASLNLPTSPHPSGMVIATIDPASIPTPTHIIGQSRDTVTVPSTLPTVSFDPATGTHSGDSVEFMLTRVATGDSTLDITASLEVAVSVTDTNGYLTTSPPASVTFDANDSEATLTVPLDPSRDGAPGSVVTATITSQDPATTYHAGDQNTATAAVSSTLPTVSFDPATGTHSGDSVEFTLTRVADIGMLDVSGSLVVTVSVTAENSYVTSPPASVTFDANDPTATLTVPLADGRDRTLGSEVTATITPQSPTPTTYSVGGQNMATATVVAELPQVSVDSVALCTDTNKLCIDFDRGTGTAAALNNVGFTLVGNVALADYLVSSTLTPGTFTITNDTTWTGSVNFAVGVGDARLQVDRNPDGITNADVNLTVTVTPGEGYQVMGDPGMATLTEDIKPAFSITAGTVSLDEINFTLTRAGRNTAVATVDVSLQSPENHVADTTTREVHVQHHRYHAYADPHPRPRRYRERYSHRDH